MSSKSGELGKKWKAPRWPVHAVLRGLRGAGGGYMSKATALVRDGSQECIIRAPGMLMLSNRAESLPLLSI
ncbi:MAG TPA: hypothetical protein DCY07_04520 [Rhodospirillaceae bacterium]|nr:hypothetical protein [Rhodospirillaceae bacterium]